MKGTTHLAAGMVLAATTQLTLPVITDALPAVSSVLSMSAEPTLAQTSAIVIGSLLPDIDKSSSLLGRYIPILPKLFKHRTVTHTLWVPIFLWVISPPLAIGCILHLLLDMCNPEGVPLLWPITKRYHMPIISVHSGGWTDKALGWVLWALTIWFYAVIAGIIPN